MHYKAMKFSSVHLMSKDRFEAAAEKLKLIATLVNLESQIKIEINC